MTETPLLRTVHGTSPTIDPDSFVAPTAVLCGDVHLGPQASVWYNAVLRADNERITIGAGSNVQDGCVFHVDTGKPVHVGERVSVGHRAVLHGCTVEDDALIGMGAVVLNGAHIGAGSMVAAGAVVLQDTVVPPGSLVAGIPGKVRRELTDAERDGLTTNAANYLALTQAHRAATDV
ncbi:carbonic anhydrase/acetyltransferase-like protein (isoleucine patch superfamily) [Mumia flava]|uniref:Carbonic anhydrase/acetyltransferase-like protein (Isoleucine patch superfamily) n=1 Tax=Mumia flava TaxID=1348852 RepID=A0A0B2B7A4_9ACTN|nr:gamma carbonic anhydrase family protein [Mumia flava]PJJ57575.1 carbonic anhydrase/acetyltransferase-like protein (isoleucine patch superfamily) [Mumia flava]